MMQIVCFLNPTKQKQPNVIIISMQRRPHLTSQMKCDVVLVNTMILSTTILPQRLESVSRISLLD